MKKKAPSLVVPMLTKNPSVEESLFEQPKTFEEYKTMMRGDVGEKYLTPRSKEERLKSYAESNHLHRKVNFRDLEELDWINSAAASIAFFTHHEIPICNGTIEVYIDSVLEFSKSIEKEADWDDFESEIFYLICHKCHPMPKFEWDNTRHIMILHLSQYPIFCNDEIFNVN